MTDAKIYWCLVVSVVEGMKHSLKNPLQLNLARSRFEPKHTRLSAGTAAGRVRLVVSPP